MSLIITYIGSKGCVIAGDKRRIGFYGPSESRKRFEEQFYSGKIKTEEELIRKADEHGITLKISNDAEKVREMGDVLIGEVKSRTTHETKRKRIYATSGAYSMIELLGSDIKTMKSGGSSIIVFGNKYTQEIAENSIKKNFKSKMKLMDVEKILESVMEEVASKTPSVSKEYDVIIKYASIDQKVAKELVRTTVLQDIKDLKNYRNQLLENIIKTTQNIQMATKIILEGDIGSVAYVNGKEIGIKLNTGVEALDAQWNTIAKHSETVNMTILDEKNVSKGDLVVIENENLCVKRTKEGLNCEFILCKSDLNINK